MACPSCGHDRNYLCGRRVGCTRCNRRWSVTAGTVMSGTKLPLTTWFRAMHIMTSTKQGVSAIELGRRLGVSYPTAWYLAKRLRRAMTERETRYVLGGSGPDGAPVVVKADDVYLGGERNQGSGPGGKTRMIAATERYEDGRMGHVAMRMVAGFTSRAVRAFADTCLTATVRVHTDGLKAFLAWQTREIPCGHCQRQQTSLPTAHCAVPRSQYCHRQSEHGSQGNAQGHRPAAYIRLSRRFLLDHKSKAQHARHDPRRMPGHSNLFSPHAPPRIRRNSRAAWLISGNAIRSNASARSAW